MIYVMMLEQFFSSNVQKTLQGGDLYAHISMWYVYVRVLVVCLALTHLLDHHFLLDYSSMLQYLHFYT